MVKFDTFPITEDLIWNFILYPLGWMFWYPISKPSTLFYFILKLTIYIYIHGSVYTDNFDQIWHFSADQNFDLRFHFTAIGSCILKSEVQKQYTFVIFYLNWTPALTGEIPGQLLSNSTLFRWSEIWCEIFFYNTYGYIFCNLISENGNNVFHLG